MLSHLDCHAMWPLSISVLCLGSEGSRSRPSLQPPPHQPPSSMDYSNSDPYDGYGRGESRYPQVLYTITSLSLIGGLHNLLPLLSYRTLTAPLGMIHMPRLPCGATTHMALLPATIQTQAASLGVLVASTVRALCSWFTAWTLRRWMHSVCSTSSACMAM